MNNMYKILESFNSLTPETKVVEAKTTDPELQKIAHNYPREVKLLIQTGDFDKDLYSALFDYYNGLGEMPYGVAKARDGDPYEWIFQRFTNDMGLDSPLSNVGQDAGLGLDKAIQGVEEEMGTYGAMAGQGMGYSSITEGSADFYRELSDLVEGKKSKPDFLDVDKDGNKKEPFKKAVKDKQVDEAAKPDFLDLDKDGNKKEPMKKAAKQKKVDEGAENPYQQRILDANKADLEEFLKTGYLDTTSDLYYQMYEYYANQMDPKVRRNQDAQYDFITGKIREIVGVNEARGDDWDFSDLPPEPTTRKIAGKRYGGSAQVDEPEDDEDDSKPGVKAAKKRGRPAGSKRAIGAKGPTGKSKLLKKGAIKEGDNEGDDMVKLAKVIASCTTPEQLEVAKKMAKNFLNKHRTADDDFRVSAFKNDMERERAVKRDLGAKAKSFNEPVAEKAPPGAKAERMVKGIKKSLSKDGHLSDKDKAIAYATTWKAHKAGKVEEAGVEEGSTGDYSAKKARAGKDIGKPGKNFEKIAKSAGEKYGSKERGEKVAGAVLKKLRGKNESKDEEKVDETTVAGAVATSTAAPKGGSKGGYQFGKGVYESINNQVEKMITEGMSINVNVDSNGQKSINVSATDEDADKLAEILKMAGIAGGGVPAVQEAQCCEACGVNPCECAVMGESEEFANSPDEEYADTDMLTNKLAGGLNKPKTTVAGDGQTTVPVTAVQVKESQEVTKIENSLWNLFKAFKK